MSMLTSSFPQQLRLSVIAADDDPLFNTGSADDGIGQPDDMLSEIGSHDEPAIQGGGAIVIGLTMLVIAAACGVIAYLAPLP